MIPKKTADLRPEKLRLILLMDARFNHNNKLIGKKMMEYGEKHELLAPEQFGSRKHKSAIDHATNKRLVLDNVRQSGRNAIYIANDAKSCYDRILLIVAYLTMRKFGVNKLVAQSTISTILHMRHHIRTRYGDSKDYYGGEKWNKKPHGCGQGNGYGPALWACISSPLLHMMRDKGYGTKLQGPISNIMVHIAAFAFVDDVDIIQTSEPTEQRANDHHLQSIAELLRVTQEAFNQWSSTLRATGGAIEPTKTFCVPIISQWQGSHKVVTGNTQEHNLNMEDGNDNQTTLQQRNPNSAFFTLGIWQSPSGNEMKQQEYLIGQINNWEHKTNLNKLTWSQARIAVQATIGRTLCYSLMATAFDDGQCLTLQKIFNKAVLGKMGIVRTTPSIIATAPKNFGGFGIMSFELQQLINHLQLIMIHGPDTSSMTHRLLQVTMETYALETGLPGDPASLPGVQYTTPRCWITQTLHSMEKYNITLTSGFTGLVDWCKEDTYIMDRMRFFFSGSSLAKINKVRMYLRIVTWSDLVSADGKRYDQNLLPGLQGYENPTPSTFWYQWPIIPGPTTSEKHFWTHSLQVAFGISCIPGMDSPKHQSVWTVEAARYARWSVDPSESVIYERKGYSCWNIWRKSKNVGRLTRASANMYEFREETQSKPVDRCRMISVMKHGSNIVLQGISRQHNGVRQSSTLHTCQNNEDNCPSALISYYLYNIQLNNGIIISDGSFDKDVMTYAYVAQPKKHHERMQNIDYKTILHGSGHASGDRADGNSYRAELAGMLAAITFTNSVCTRYNVGKGRCIIYCDNKGVLNAVFGHKRPTPRWSSYDLVRQLRQAVKYAPIMWKCQHVKGHQDNTGAFTSLDSIAQGNVIVDHLANLQRDNNAIDETSSKNWVPTINGRSIGGNLDSRLMEAIFRPAMMQRWGKLFGLHPSQYHIVDWNLFFHCLSTQQSKAQTFWTKYNARLLPVGKNLKRRRHSDSESCPCCGLPEDHDHLLRCKHPEMENAYNQLTMEISNTLWEGTSDFIARSIMDLLEYFRTTIGEDSEGNNITMVHRNLGPRPFYAGLWSNQWHALQVQHFRNTRSKRSATVWLSKLIHTVQRIPYSMWHTRNQILHRNNENFTLTEQQTELDSQIDDLYDKKPHARFMAHCDNLYFTKHGRDKVKTMTIRRKINWVAGANLIMVKYDRVTTEQATRFTSYFQWDWG